MTDLVLWGGFLAGALAGFAASYGRLCTMAAIESALIAKDYRGLKVWGVALATAITVTQTLAYFDIIDVKNTVYAAPRVHILGTALGGLLFGLGMTLVGTCSFGLLVRAGSGDIRAATSSIVTGILAMSATAGYLNHYRSILLQHGQVDFHPFGGSTMVQLVGKYSPIAPVIATMVLVALLALAAIADPRLRRRPRMLISAMAIGLAVALGWYSTSIAMDRLLADRPESLSFVAPVGRALLQFMMEPFRNAGFGVAAMFGVIASSTIVTCWRREFRWEAFDDPIEMRRHVLGGSLMGIGGVLSQGCTIGQGLSAASVLAVSAPIFIVCVLAGARVGLTHLLDDHA